MSCVSIYNLEKSKKETSTEFCCVPSAEMVRENISILLRDFLIYFFLSWGKREADQKLPYLWRIANECEMPSSSSFLKLRALSWPFLSSSMGWVLRCCSASTSHISSAVYTELSQTFVNLEFPNAYILCLDLIWVTFIFGKKGEWLW